MSCRHHEAYDAIVAANDSVNNTLKQLQAHFKMTKSKSPETMALAARYMGLKASCRTDKDIDKFYDSTLTHGMYWQPNDRHNQLKDPTLWNPHLVPYFNDDGRGNNVHAGVLAYSRGDKLTYNMSNAYTNKKDNHVGGDLRITQYLNFLYGFALRPGLKRRRKFFHEHLWGNKDKDQIEFIFNAMAQCDIGMQQYAKIVRFPNLTGAGVLLGGQAQQSAKMWVNRLGKNNINLQVSGPVKGIQRQAYEKGLQVEFKRWFGPEMGKIHSGIIELWLDFTMLTSRDLPTLHVINNVKILRNDLSWLTVPTSLPWLGQAPGTLWLNGWKRTLGHFTAVGLLQGMYNVVRFDAGLPGLVGHSFFQSVCAGVDLGYIFQLKKLGWKEYVAMVPSAYIAFTFTKQWLNAGDGNTVGGAGVADNGHMEMMSAGFFWTHFLSFSLNFVGWKKSPYYRQL
jgi:hypothetical protein